MTVAASGQVVLVGAGHAHLQVLEAWRERPLEGTPLTVVVDRPHADYSGMIPAAVAGEVDLDALRIPLEPLVEAAGGRLMVSPLTGVDPVGRRLVLEDGRSLPYRVASLNLGSAAGGREIPGVPDNVVPARDVETLVERAAADGEGAVVVGGGAAGVELAACLAARWSTSSSSGRGEVTLLEAGPRLLGGLHPRVARKARAALERRGVRVRTEIRVAGVTRNGVSLEGGEEVPAETVVWAAGAAPPPVLSDTPLPADEDGYVRVRSTLQVTAHPDLFAVGSCASVADFDLPRAGVHAVRQGPVLTRNLEAFLAGRVLEEYQPRRSMLTLLNLGDGTALGTKWGWAMEGRWVRAVKKRIDRRWVGRFAG